MNDLNAYWAERGKEYAINWQRTPEYASQEAALLKVILPLNPTTILDMGCGFGRMGTLITAALPGVRYTGVDVSEAQLEAAHQRLPHATLHQGDVLTWQADQRYDVVLAVELLMHIPPSAVGQAIHRLVGMAGTLVTCDWDEPHAERQAWHNWSHDYDALLPGAARIAVGRQAIWVWRP